DAAVLRCLEVDPARRPASAAEFLAALPGGDPLEAGLRGGETPCPEMGAAAGAEAPLSTGRAWGFFGIALFSLAAAILLTAAVGGLDRVPMARTPDMLRDRAGDIVRQLGKDVPPRTIEWWFQLDDGYAEWSLRQ